MDWIQVTIFTTSAGIEPVSGILYQLGITGIEIEDEADFQDFLENNKQCWDYVDEELLQEKHKETCVKIYVSDNPAGHELLLAVREAVRELKGRDEEKAFGRLDIMLDNLCEEDWANNWKQYFHPMPVGEKILIKPEWEELQEPTNRIVFNINPGMSFGTGSHYTTQLCIEQLEKYVHPGDAMLDLGCGSGILSIISILLGAQSAVAVDIDPNAADIAYENAARNGVGKDRYTVLAGNILEDKKIQDYISQKKYPVVAANIVADVIIALAPAARQYITNDGVFITSGIIEERVNDTAFALSESGFDIIGIERRADWASIICKAKME